MKPRFYLSVFVLLLSLLACGFPGSAPATPEVESLPPTPDLPLSSDATPVPPPATAPPPTSPFTGTWSGSDPDDGSIITLTLAQSGNSLTGAFADTFSGDVNPGYAGAGSGTVSSDTTATITFNMTRGDGRAVTAVFDLTLSNQNNTITLGCETGCPITLQK